MGAKANPLVSTSKTLQTLENPKESFILVRGFPLTWAELQVKFLFVVFGGTASVCMVSDADFGCAAQVVMKDITVMERAALSLKTDIGDGDMIQECHIYCEHVLGRLVLQQV